ncbi:DUF559 domain-containing protein [Microbacterium sp. NE2HP2]|uniref:endonuclease domain-containing protein n=1 Tax=Microbacterium TaxID=33882 RepID=UPI0022AF1257|nr:MULTISPECIES: DUF559 domain-containing protein [Microbacterium]MCZ4067687.1 DUF559 domain-containing protein [Microbacterium sp. H37-C3]MDD7944607.1 DUF559 domain-containing protein [Microbacterium plantarum]WHE36910.1 DUF559 domain-containing protein [Microbacterium sp. BDGP8]
MRRTPLPAELPTGFVTETAREHGVTAGRLRARDLTSPLHGTRARGPLNDLDMLRLIGERVPGHAFFCGPTAAAVHRMPLPAVLRDAAAARPHLAVALPANRVRRPEVVGRALAVRPDDIACVDGIRLTTIERTWVDLAGAVSLGALVAAGDALISRRGPRTTIDALGLAHARAGRSRGAVRRAEALTLLDDGAESPRESELRVLLVRAGLPRPETNVVIRDGWRFVARVDLLYRDARLVLEYDGDYHRDSSQWSRDQSRRAELESLGYRVTVVTARDFDDPGALVRRIRRLLSAR